MFRGNVAAQEILAGQGSAGDDRQKLLRWTRRLPPGDTNRLNRTSGWRFIMEIDILGIDLAKQVFVRPASRVSFCLTGAGMT